MSSRHRNLEPLGRWHAKYITVYFWKKKDVNFPKIILLYYVVFHVYLPYYSYVFFSGIQKSYMILIGNVRENQRFIKNQDTMYTQSLPNDKYFFVCVEAKI